MKVIEPTHKEIMKYLNCGYYGYYNKNKCQCHNPKQFKFCYEEAKKRLTYTEYTEEEIKKMKEEAKIDNPNDAMKGFELFWGYCEDE